MDSSGTLIAKMKTAFKKKTDIEPDLTYVEGVGHIPRDIYKYVTSDPMGDLPRYSRHIVVQHFLIFSTFIILSVTGLPIFFSKLFWAPRLVSLFGGIDNAEIIHKIAASVMIFASLYHLVTVVGGTVRKIARKEFDYKRTQIPRLQDLYDMIDDIKFFLGINAYRPKMGKFMYKQKLHYLAIIWGTLVLIGAGTALLFPDIVAKVFSSTVGRLLPQISVAGGGGYAEFLQELARLMHADEAIMALIVLALWHMSNVHLVPGRFPIQWTVLTGRITREHQIEEHFLEYINNLKEIPEEREYMKKLLIERELEMQKQKNAADNWNE